MSTELKDRIIRAELTLEIPSRSRAIEPAIRLIMAMLETDLSDERMQQVELGLDEAVRNAYEHGNLGLSSEKKKELCEKGTLETWLQKQEEELGSKPIFIRCSLSRKSFECVLVDQGSGFEWRGKEEAKTVPAQDELHGRGIFLINKTFDVVEYNNKGNEVRLKLIFEES